MVKRYMNKKNDSERAGNGYGSGTYWPAGWGEPRAADAVVANGYRISTDAPRFRRRDEWRVSRDRFTDQDLVAVYEEHRQEEPVRTNTVALPLIKRGDVDAIDRAIVQLLATVSLMPGQIELYIPVRYLRARLKLLHDQLSVRGVRDLPLLNIPEGGSAVVLGKAAGVVSVARLSFEETGMCNGTPLPGPHLVLHRDVNRFKVA